MRGHQPVDELAYLPAAIEKFLKDGQWHKLSEFMPLVASLSPELCSQRYMTNVNKRRRKDTAATYPMDKMVHNGRRRIIGGALASLWDRGLVEVRSDPLDQTKSYRATEAMLHPETNQKPVHKRVRFRDKNEEHQLKPGQKITFEIGLTEAGLLSIKITKAE